MKKFSSIKAAFAIIDFSKSNPKFTIKFILAFALVMLIYLSAIFSTGYFDLITQMIASSEAPDSWPYDKAFMDATNRINLVSIAYWFIYIVFTGAGLRKTIRNEEIGFFGFTWGKDETRILLSIIVLFGIIIGAYLAIILIGIVSFGVIALLKNLPILPYLFGFCIFCLVLYFIYGLIIRLSQYGVITIAQRKMGTIDSIKETKDHGWTFFWAYFINSLVCIFFYIFIFALGFLAYSFTGKFPTNLIELFNPAWFGVCLIGSLFMGAYILSKICLGSYAYHMMHEGEELPQESISENVWKN